MGAIYRSNQQVDAAEIVYKIALVLDDNSYAASNNLAVLYRQLDRVADHHYYLKKSYGLMQSNPYYYFYLAQVDQSNDNLSQAIINIKRAIKIKSDELRFYDFLEELNGQLERLAINELSSVQTSSGENDAIHEDMTSFFPSKVQLRP
jgi:predicted Zn-dependent protease